MADIVPNPDFEVDFRLGGDKVWQMASKYIQSKHEIYAYLNQIQGESSVNMHDEALARGNADAALRESIVQTDAALREIIGTETEERMEADAALQENIDDETRARISADAEFFDTIKVEGSEI
jgi:hypothetical protein